MASTLVNSKPTGKWLFVSVKYNNRIHTGLGFDIPENVTQDDFIGFNPFETIAEAEKDCIEEFNSVIYTPTEPELIKVERTLRHEFLVYNSSRSKMNYASKPNYIKYWWTGYKRFKYVDSISSFLCIDSV